MCGIFLFDILLHSYTQQHKNPSTRPATVNNVGSTNQRVQLARLDLGVPHRLVVKTGASADAQGQKAAHRMAALVCGKVSEPALARRIESNGS